jgi:hypothetical protein
MARVKTDSAQTQGLLEAIAWGNRHALELFLERYRPRLELSFFKKNAPFRGLILELFAVD